MTEPIELLALLLVFGGMQRGHSSSFFPSAQCEWLLGDRKPTTEDLDKGIDPASPLFQAILENPVVQLGLTSPKTLLGKSQGFPGISVQTSETWKAD